MPTDSISRRLLFAIWFLLLLVLGIPFVYIALSLKADLHTDMTNSAVAELRTVEWVLSKQGPFASYEELDKWATEYQKASGVRFSYIVNDRLVADSSVPYDDVQRSSYHGDRPEILEARSKEFGTDERPSETLGKNFLYAAIYSDAVPGLEPGFIRLSQPAFAVAKKISRLYVGLGLIFIAAFLGSGLLCTFIVRAIMKGAWDMVTTSKAIGDGHYHRRLHPSKWRELQPLVVAVNCMAENIEKQLDELEEQNGRWTALFNGMREGVMVVGRDGKISSFNKSVQRMFPGLVNPVGVSPMEATMIPELQEQVDALCGNGDGEASGVLDSEQENALADQEYQAFCVSLPDGRHLEITSVPFRHGDSRELVLVFTDVSERERVEQLRRDFVANVSHEIKTPLTSIRGYAELLLDNPDTPAEQRNHFLQIIMKNTEHMVKIAASLLVLAKSEHQTRSPKAEPLDLMPILRGTIADLMPLAQSEGIEIALDVAQELREQALMIQGNTEGLSEVFHNLLDNALKYGKEGSRVDIAVTREHLVPPANGSDIPAYQLQQTRADARLGTFVTIRFRDFGPGIPASSREQVFQRFYRMTANGEHQKNGHAGLGLSICRRIIKSLGGHIWAESPADGGPGVVLTVALRPAE